MAKNPVRTSFKARWIFTGEADRPLIEQGCIVSKVGVIEAVGTETDVLPDSAHIDSFCDFQDALIVPGFVNAHAHLDLTCYRGQLPAGPLWPWIETLIELRRAPGAAERELDSVAEGIQESIEHGVTCIGDITRMPMPARTLAHSPMRGVSFVELISGAMVQPNDAVSLEARVKELAALDSPGKFVTGVSPHAPYSVTPRDLRSVFELTAKENRPLAMHYLETIEEREWLRGSGGPLAEFLDRMGAPNLERRSAMQMAQTLVDDSLWAKNSLLAHVNYASDDDIRRLARRFVSVVWCPRAHRYYGHHGHPWKNMIDAGINVCLGTDSAACVPTLSILDELREIRRQESSISAELLFRMGTANGAKALGFGTFVGSLTPGKRTDFVVLECCKGDRNLVLDAVLESSKGPVTTKINGQSVFSGA